jgi:putative ABC transport system permease protein
MFLHYLELAWRNTLAAKGLSALMVLALALGIGACMTTLTVYHVLSGDPIPHKSARLFNVQLDASDMVGWKVGEEPTFDLTRYDATALLREKKALRQVMSSGFNTAVGLPDAGVKPSSPACA